MAGIALNRFDIAAVQLQFISDTGMAKTVENDLRQIILFNELSKKSCDARLLRRHTQAIGHDKIEICVFTAQSFFREVLISFPFDQHLCYRLRKEDLSCTGSRLGLLQYKNRLVAFPQLREYTKNILLFQSFHNALAHTLQFLIHIDAGFSGSNAFWRDIYAIPGQSQQLSNSKGTGKGQIDGQLQPLILTYFDSMKQSRRIPDLAFFRFRFWDRCIYCRILLHEFPLYSLVKCAAKNVMYFSYSRGRDKNHILISLLLRDAVNRGRFQKLHIILFQNTRSYVAQLHIADDR